MASSLLLLLDDIATVLDDVAVMTKVAAKKTAGVLGDDLALNAQQVSGVSADRELPVVWAVAKGSALNKLILIPAALAISALLPWAVLPLLMVGGLYLCFEGVEKLVHAAQHRRAAGAGDAAAESPAAPVDMAVFEREKIQGAVRTDFILSAEIIVIALGTVAAESLGRQFAVLASISALMTVGVYGFVAGIVKLDDAGLHLVQKSNAAAQAVGRGLLAFAPVLMKTLSLAGTAAMFLVGGGILGHGIPVVHHAIQAATAAFVFPGASLLLPSLLNAVTGLLAGGAALLGWKAVQRLRGR